jgi:hypothetical protein
VGSEQLVEDLVLLAMADFLAKERFHVREELRIEAVLEELD